MTRTLILAMAFVVFGSGPGLRAASDDGPVIDFNRDVRPILSENCYACHGPDKNVRKADLRFDLKDDPFRDRDGHAVIVPGNVEDSALIERLVSEDPEEMMPPPKFGKAVSKAQVETLRTWIKQGAKWDGHWAYLPPKRGEPPEVRGRKWVRNPVDQFILKRLEDMSLAPAAEADRATLIRRLTLDLTGLPPTIAEVDAYLADSAPDAYERLVDRLLASDRYGERMAQSWLDLARYADTNGYHIDNHRDIWLYRDWVIDAFNKNKPFDVFTVEQMAGDLLPNPTVDQKIATGFNRAGMVNFEGGADPDEYLSKYVIDRVTTTSQVFLGSTLACAECHDHKYDPFSQKDFYRFYAFFHNVPEKGLDGSKESPAPRMAVPVVAQTKRLDELKGEVASLEARIAGPLPEIDAAQVKWEADRKAAREQAAAIWKTVEPTSVLSRNGATLTKQADGSVLASGENPSRDIYEAVLRTDATDLTGLRVEALPDPSLSKESLSRSGNGNFVLSGLEIEATPADQLDVAQPVSLASATADFVQPGNFQAVKVIDADAKSGWSVQGDQYKDPRYLAVAASQPFGFPGGTILRVRLKFEAPYSQHTIGRFRLALTSAPSPAIVPLYPMPVEKALAVAPETRTPEQAKAAKDYFRAEISPEAKALVADLAAKKKAATDFEASIPTTMVMEEMPKPRKTFILVRGDYRSKGDEVVAGVPESLPPLPAGVKADRLALARWLVDPANPLVSRVTVNRYWQHYFGTGLVKTANDFGSQGEWPTHHELIDWLSTEFIRTGWDVKAMQRLLVTSAAYRQVSKVDANLLERDPYNRFLARGPRFRLDAEAIRDNALAVSGLLNPAVGGRSVYPYQPPGLWEEVSFGGDFSSQKYTPSKGTDLNRRGLYTYWKRSLPHPSLSAFDAPNRETCTVSRARTNTPLQALVLMNDPTYVEASRALGQRIIAEGGDGTERRLEYAFRLCLARPPKPREMEVLARVFGEQLDHFKADPKAAKALISIGESARPANMDEAELAAWTAIGNVLLNLDETITKG
ncbi:PSD1 and planctomycete cytochrome C domain-containing protein [Isosphaeraceae bacterium EP7]